MQIRLRALALKPMMNLRLLAPSQVMLFSSSPKKFAPQKMQKESKKNYDSSKLEKFDDPFS